MNEAVAMENAGTNASEGNQEVGKVVGMPENYEGGTPALQTESKSEETPSPTQETADVAKSEPGKPALQEGQWLLKEGVLGSGDRPSWLLEKYGYNMENQAKAYPDAERRLGEQGKQLGAFTGAPDKYDFSSIEDENFEFDTKDPLFGKFITECQNGNVSQDFAVKIAGFAKNMLAEPSANLEEEATKYGEGFEADKTNIINWVNNNNSQADGMELLESVKTAGGMRALRNLMNTNGFRVPTTEVPTLPRETLTDVKSEFAKNLYDGEKLAENPDNLKKWVDKFQKIGG